MTYLAALVLFSGLYVVALVAIAIRLTVEVVLSRRDIRRVPPHRRGVEPSDRPQGPPRRPPGVPEGADLHLERTRR